MPEHQPIVLDFDAETVPDVFDDLKTIEPETAIYLIECVGRGLDLLELIRPDWFRAVWFDRLELRSSTNDILGQVFGDYEAGCVACVAYLATDESLATRFGLKPFEGGYLFESDQFGFGLDERMQSHRGCTTQRCIVDLRWDSLTSLWIDAIRYRFKQEREGVKP